MHKLWGPDRLLAQQGLRTLLLCVEASDTCVQLDATATKGCQPSVVGVCARYSRLLGQYASHNLVMCEQA